jgi:hypothetical protein
MKGSVQLGYCTFFFSYILPHLEGTCEPIWEPIRVGLSGFEWDKFGNSFAELKVEIEWHSRNTESRLGNRA